MMHGPMNVKNCTAVLGHANYHGKCSFLKCLRQLVCDKAVVHPAGRFELYVARCHFEITLKQCTIICSLQL
jgi:hypothetical protein